MFRGFRCYSFRRLIDIQVPDVHSVHLQVSTCFEDCLFLVAFDETAEVSWCSWMFLWLKKHINKKASRWSIQNNLWLMTPFVVTSPHDELHSKRPNSDSQPIFRWTKLFWRLLWQFLVAGRSFHGHMTMVFYRKQR